MILKFLPLIISTLGYLGFAVLILQIKPLLAPLLWACFITTFTYLFALAGLLEFGAHAALILGALLGVAALLMRYRNLPKPTTNWILTIGFVAPVIVTYTAIPADFVFLGWDEVGFWGKTQKLVFDTNSLLTAESPLTLRSYPPGQQLFQYYFTKAAWWSEKNLLLAQNVFLFSGLLAAIGALITRPTWSLLVYLTCLPFIYFFHFDYTTIYADPMLACVFAGCLGLALKPRTSITDDMSLALCLCGFILLKDIAAVFAALTIALYSLNVFLTTPHSEPSQSITRIKRSGVALLICSVSLFAILRSWHLYASLLGSIKNEPLKITLATLSQESFQQRLGKTLATFFELLLKPNYFLGNLGNMQLGLSLAALIATLCLLGALIVALNPRQKRLVSLVAVVGIAAGAFGYLMLLLWLYLTYFTEYEGTRLASFDRYSMTYLLAWVLVTYALLISTLLRFKAKALVAVPLIGLLFIYAFVPTKFYENASRVSLDQVSFEKKKKAQLLADEVKKHIKPTEKVYFIAQNTNGYERHLFDYTMLPYPPNDCWSVGEKYSDGDVWSCARPLDFLLQGYQYLAIYHADERFWSDNARFFVTEGLNREFGVYAIQRDAKGQIMLSPTQAVRP